MPVGLKEIQNDWEALGADDPLHAILNDPKTSNKRWRVDEFFRAGQRETEAVFQWLQSRGTLPQYWDCALDFGCGVGRLTRALSKQFQRVTGVDIAPSMLDMARRLDPPANCHFVLNESDRLQKFEDGAFDFVYSSIVLQHLPSEISVKYISEFFRVLRPGGVAVFQIPVARKVPLPAKIRVFIHKIRETLKLGTRIRSLAGKSPEGSKDAPQRGKILMHWVPEEQILQIIEESGAKVTAKAYTNSCERSYNGNLSIHAEPHYHSHFLSRIFAVRKQ